MKIIAIFFFGFMLVGCRNFTPSVKTGLEGKPIPSFKLLLSDSISYVNTSIGNHGSPVVLFYFSPECPYCRAQMKEMVNEIKDLKTIKFYIFTTWPFQEMKAFKDHYELSKYDNLIVGVDFNNFFMNYFKPGGVPYTAVYSRDGLLKKAFLGKINPRQIVQTLE